MNANISIGISIEKDRWKLAAEDLQEAAPVISQILRNANFEERGNQDAQDFENDLLLAITALNYVAEFATEKCRFIPL